MNRTFHVSFLFFSLLLLLILSPHPEEQLTEEVLAGAKELGLAVVPGNGANVPEQAEHMSASSPAVLSHSCHGTDFGLRLHEKNPPRRLAFERRNPGMILKKKNSMCLR